MSLKGESLKGSNNQIQCKNFANKSCKLVFKSKSEEEVQVILGCCSKPLLCSPAVSSFVLAMGFLGPSFS